MRSRRDVIALAVVLTCLLVIVLIARPHAELRQEDPRATTFRSGPGGARALLLLLRELDIPTTQQLAPWSAEAEDGAVVVLAPVQAPTAGEVEALLEWVESGGVVIHGAGGASDPVLRELGLALAALPPTDSGGERLRRGLPASRAARGLRTGDVGRAALTDGIDPVPGFRRAFADTAPALGTAEVLLETEDGRAVVVRLRLGAGAVVAWSDAAVLTNARLRQSDGAAILFARLAAGAVDAGGTVRFDEYHHGFRDGGPARALWRFLTRTQQGRVVLQLAVAVLALLLLYGRRFGAPLIEQQGRRRSPLEHVDAVAAAYRKAGARRTARRLIVAGLERRLGRRVLDGRAGQLTVPGAAAPGSSPAGRRLVREWERGELVALAAAVDDYAAEVRRWK